MNASNVQQADRQNNNNDPAYSAHVGQPKDKLAYILIYKRSYISGEENFRMKRKKIIDEDAALDLTLETITGLKCEMMCAICMETVKDTMTTECLHRYCRGTAALCV